MPQQPSREKPDDIETEECPENDQLKHRYYYDDAHGYQDYEPDNREDDDELVDPDGDLLAD